MTSSASTAPDQTTATATTASAGRPAARPGMGRATVEFLVVLGLGIMLLRSYAAEAYIVPTGSMAPTLLGYHRSYRCPNCEFPVVVGVDEQGHSGPAVCPNCGQEGMGTAEVVDCSGDRLLVEKFLYDLRRPHRWEVAVFRSPAEPGQVYVKRVVGLPGESIRLTGGDLEVDGQIARKSLAEQRATRVLVFDNDFRPADSDRYPRWGFRRGRSSRPDASTWRVEGSRFVHDRAEGGNTHDAPTDWLEYRHWDPRRGRYGAVRDDSGYNGGEVGGDHVVGDLAVEVDLQPGAGCRQVAVRIDRGSDRFVVELPVDGLSSPVIRRNGREWSRPALTAADRLPAVGRPARCEVSLIDRQVAVAVGGVPLFEPVPFDEPTGTAWGAGAPSSPVAIGIVGAAEVSRLRVYRDIYYTEQIAPGPRRPFGVGQPHRLGPDEFFVLGDNSPVSNDSRFWEKSPAVLGDQFVGKPVFVHLPGRVWAVRAFGRVLGWIPDPREIRYIR